MIAKKTEDILWLVHNMISNYWPSPDLSALLDASLYLYMWPRRSVDLSVRRSVHHGLSKCLPIQTHLLPARHVQYFFHNHTCCTAKSTRANCSKKPCICSNSHDLRAPRFSSYSVLCMLRQAATSPRRSRQKSKESYVAIDIYG